MERARRRRRLRRAHARQRGADRRRDPGCDRHRRRCFAEDRYSSDCAADPRTPRRARRARQQCVEPRPGAAGIARRHRLRRLRSGARDEPARAVSADPGTARRIARLRRRGSRRGRAQRIERRRADPVPALGRVRRVQGGAAPHERHLARRAARRRDWRAFARPRRHGHRTARARDPGRRSDDTA